MLAPGNNSRTSLPAPNCTAVPELPMIVPLSISVLSEMVSPSEKRTPTPAAPVPVMVPSLATGPAEP